MTFDDGTTHSAEVRGVDPKTDLAVLKIETRRGPALGLSLVAAVAKLHEVEVRLEDGRPGLRVVLQWPPASAAC